MNTDMRLKNIEKAIKLAISDENISQFILNALDKGINLEDIGTLFEKSLEQLERKNKGQFYTPKEIVNYMVSYLKVSSRKKIIDPACGCGSFLLAIMEEIKKQEKDPNFSNIYGIDINKNAAEITKLSLIIKSDFKKEYIEIFDKNIVVGNSITKNKKIDPMAINWENQFNDVLKNGGFDIVIGNPPYVTLKKGKDFDPNESIYKHIIKGPVNAATLMIGRGLEYLKKGGILAFVLPKTILHVNSYSQLRSYILNNTSILHIVDLGLKFKDVRGEQIILILKNEKPSPNHMVEIKVTKYPEKRLKHQPSIFIKQSIFKAFNNKILLFDNELCYSLLQKIQSKGKRLYDVVDGQIFRGLPLNNKVFEQFQYITDEKIIKGKSIVKFKINSIGYVNEKELKKINKKILKRNKSKKIVVQNIFSSESGIIAAYDNEGILTVDTVTNIIIQNDDLAKYLLGLLHSKLINFYISFALFNRGRLTMHIDRSYIGEIPIVISEQIEYRKIIELVKRAIESKGNIKEILKAIDEEVYNIYDLTNEEINFIEREMDNLLSKKSRW